MHRKKLTPCQIRNLMVTALLSFILAMPLLSQPLGLASAWNDPTAKTDDNMDTDEDATLSAGYALAPLDQFDAGAELYNRGLQENGTTTATLTDPTADSYDPSVNGPYDDDYDEDDAGAATGETGEPATDASPAATEPTDPPYAAVDYVLYISANTLNLRAGPSTDSEIVAQLKFGDKVQCQGENADWMQVLYQDTVGYLKTEYTSKTMVFESVKETVYVDANKLNLRSEPSTSAEILDTLKNEAKLTRLGIGDGWSKVKTSGGTVGYVASDYLTKTAPVVVTKTTKSSKSTGSSAPATRDGPTYSGSVGQVVDLAYSALGVHYVHGGSSMSGFDCSGFVSWVYRQIGITVPRSTSGYYNIGTGVSYSDLRAGDIICMDTRSSDGKTSITHVGIYVGNGNMIHASSRLDRVDLRSVSNYLSWGVKLITIRRILD